MRRIDELHLNHPFYGARRLARQLEREGFDVGRVHVTAWTDVLDAAGVRISMDGKGRWIDNVFIERLWRSVKYEDIYLRAYENGRDLQAGLTRYFDFYNRRRIHQSHEYQTPDEIYYATDAAESLAIAA